MKIILFPLLPSVGLGFITLPSLRDLSVNHVRPSSINVVTMAAVATQPQTKFEKMKMKWKGQVNRIPAEDLEISYADFESLLGEQRLSFSRDEVVVGTVVQFEHQSALVDIGGKASAYLPLREVSLVPVDKVEDVVSLDQTYEFKIVSGENENGQVTVSLKRLQFEKAWERLQAMQLEDSAFLGEVVSVNRGGAVVLVEGLRAFLPGSHMVGGVPSEEAVGLKLKLKFLEVNAETGKLVVSNRRAVLEEEMKELSRGDVVNGVVKAVKPYGAFVDILGMSGLLHISQISYDRIDDLTQVLQQGMKLKCMIIDHDKVNGRIALSTKTLEPEPGDMIKDPKKVFDMAEETAKKVSRKNGN